MTYYSHCYSGWPGFQGSIHSTAVYQIISWSFPIISVYVIEAMEARPSDRYNHHLGRERERERERGGEERERIDSKM